MSAPHQQPAEDRSPAPHEDPTPPDARRVEPSSQRMAEGAQKLSESGIPQARQRIKIIIKGPTLVSTLNSEMECDRVETDNANFGGICRIWKPAGFDQRDQGFATGCTEHCQIDFSQIGE